jgi:Tfp pilus assembly protein PilN
MIEINLLPGAKKKTRRGGGGRQLKLPAALTGLAGGDALKDKWLLGAVASLLIAAAALGWLYTSQSRAEASLLERQEKAVADSTRYAAVLRERVRAEATRDTVLRQLTVIRSIDDDRFIWPHIMDEISRALPAFTWIQSVSFSGAAQGSKSAQIVGAIVDTTAKKDTTAKSAGVPDVARDTVRLRLQGQTVDIQAMTRFMRDLEQSPFFERVNLEKSELVLQEGKEIMQFSIDAYFSRPDSTAIRRVPLTLSVR